MLNNMDKNTPFRVPENYFQNLNAEIISKLPEKEKKKKIVPLWRSITQWSAVAAVIVGVTAVGINQLNQSSDAIISDTQTEIMSSSEQLASTQNDYYLFLEDEAAQMIYKDSFYSDQF